MRRSTVLAILIITAIAALIVLMGVDLTAGAQAAGEPSPSPSPSPSPTATPGPPASSARVKAALRSRAKAVKAWREWNRARCCLSMRAERFGELNRRKPLRSASEATWRAAGREWRRSCVAYKGWTVRLVQRMKHPGGSSNGVRWIPLARWVGWENRALRNLAQLIMNESSGRQNAVSATNDHGLVQFNACWAGTFKRKMKCAFFPNVYDPEKNLTFAWYVYHVVQHNSFLPAWRGDPAAQW